MPQFSKHARAAALVVVSIAAGTSLALPGGAPTGFNGSPSSFGSSCVLCHSSFQVNSGVGSVSVLDLPPLYVFDQTYTLRVRVQDDAQVGAGFEFSVEDPAGAHLGQLIIVDPVNTRDAGFGDLFFITHTNTGRTNALNSWVALGKAAEFTIQWRAPQVDSGPIGFYAAGVASNDDRSPGADFVYTNSAQVSAANLGDLNGDGAIDTADLGLLIAAFGSNDPVADLNNDGVVDTADLGLLIAVFGT